MTEDGALDRPRRAEYLIMLDLVRFLAATLVMALHLGFWGWWKKGDEIGTLAKLFPDYPKYPELISFTWFGWVGVQIFFVISGLVIVMSAEKAIALDFLRSRFLRIYPVAWISATISLVIIVSTNWQLGSSVFLSYLNTMIVSPYPFWIDGVYWTLVLELVFYGSVFLIIAVGRSKNLIGFGVALGGVSSFYIIGLASDLLPAGWLFTMLLLRHGVFFSIGMLLWKLGSMRGSIPWHNVAFLILFSVAGAIEILYTTAEKLDALNLTAPLYPPIVAWLVMLSCIWASAAWPEALNRQLYPARHILRVLGLATYPLYLLHQTVGGVTGAFASNAGFTQEVSLLIAVSASLAASICVAILLEPRVRCLAAVGFDKIVAGLMKSKLLPLREQ